MRKFIVAAAAVLMLSGVASAQSTDEKPAVSHTVKVKKHRSTTGSGGYSEGVPARDPGRYKNMPDKDGLNSKAMIQDQ